MIAYGEPKRIWVSLIVLLTGMLLIPTAVFAAPPVLSSPTAINIDSTGAAIGATIDSNGGATITEYGIVWNTTGSPTTADNKEVTASNEPGLPYAYLDLTFPLPANTRIYHRGYAINTDGTGYSPQGSFYIEPATQASNITFSGVSTNSMTINWTRGTGDGSIVVIKESIAITGSPIDGMAYAANPDITVADDIDIGEYVVYAGSGTSVTATNLQPGLMYYVKVFEYSGSGAASGYDQGINYLQTGPAGSQRYTLDAEPTTQASNVTFSGVTSSAMTVNYNRGDGDSVIVLMKAGSPVDADPVDGTEYNSNLTFGAGDEIGTGNYVVFYNNAGSSIDVFGLSESTTYHVAVYEAGDVGSGSVNYLLNPATGQQTTLAAVAELSSPTATGISSTGATLGATIDDNVGDSILEFGIVWNTMGSPTTADNKVVSGFVQPAFLPHTYSDPASGLPAGTKVYYRGYAINSSGTGYSVQGSFYTEPATQASNVTFSGTTTNSMTVNWTRGSGDGVIMALTDIATVDPFDGDVYTANSVYGSGDALIGGEYIVYKGTGTSVTVTGLQPDMYYEAWVYEYSGSEAASGYDKGINYLQTNPASGGRATMATEPTTQASGVDFTGVDSGSLTVQWTRGDGDSIIMLMKEGAPVDADPVDGTEYTSSPAFGLGDEIGTGNFVVYTGTGTSTTVGILKDNTTHYIALYEMGGTHVNSQNYLLNPARGSAYTLGNCLLGSPETMAEGTGALVLVDVGGTCNDVVEYGTVWGTSPEPTGNASAKTDATSLSASFGDTRTGLPEGTKVYIRGYVVHSASTEYSWDGTFYTEPATQASSVTFSEINNDSMTVNWTRGSGDGVIVLMKSGSPVDGSPSDGTEYTASATFGSGSQLGTGNYVVYKGAGTGVNVIGLKSSTTYNISVFEYSGSGSQILGLHNDMGINYQEDVPATGSQSSAAPTPPSNVEVTATGNPGDLKIAWENPPDASFSHIHIYRSTTEGVIGTQIADNVTGIVMTDHGLASETTYYYTVRSADTAGNESINTDQYSATTPDDTAPTPPLLVSATPDTSVGGKVDLVWTNPSDPDHITTIISRATATGGPYTDIATVPAAQNTYSDTGLTNGLQYYYVVKAVDDAGNVSANSIELWAIPSMAGDTTPPGEVISFTPTDTTNGGELDLSWTNPNNVGDEDLTGVRVYRVDSSVPNDCTGADADQTGILAFDLAGTPGEVMGVTDNGLQSGTTYCYEVHTVDMVGNESTHNTQHMGTPTDGLAPYPVTRFTAIYNGNIQLIWGKSPSSDAQAVNIYSNNGSGAIDYVTPIAVVPGDTNTWTLLNPTVGSEYLFHLRVKDQSGNEELNFNKILSHPFEIPAANKAMAYIPEPMSGSKIDSGSLVSIVQRVIFGEDGPPAVAQWNHEETPDSGVYSGIYDNVETYSSISLPDSSGSTSKLCLSCHQNNPIPTEHKDENDEPVGWEMYSPGDSGDPYADEGMPVPGNVSMACLSCHGSTGSATLKSHVRDYIKIWNTTGLSEGNYRLRTVVKDIYGVDDPNPSFITVKIVASGGDVNEGINAEGERIKSGAAYTVTSSSFRMASQTGITSVGIPEGALTSDTTLNIREISDANEPTVPLGYESAGEFRELTLSSGQTSFEGGNKAVVYMPYPDTNGDGIVDGTNKSAYDMQVCRQNGASWQCLDSFARIDSRTVGAETDGFSVFGLMAPPRIFGSGAWNMVSVPLTPVPNAPSDVFGLVTTNWRYILRWDPALGDYRAVSSINPGESYLVYGNGGNLGSVAGTETPNAEFSIPLSAGWNMIGHPFRYKVALSGVKMNYSGFDYSLDEAETNGWLFATLFKLSSDGSSYERVNTAGGVIEAWKGYWIYSSVDCTLKIPNTPL